MDGYNFPNASLKELTSHHSVNAMYNILKNTNEPITLIALGPLTNIALLFNSYPESKSLVKEIILMGGSTGRGNITPLAEFNIYCDPEAAHVVFNSGIPLTMIGLDLARQALFTHEFITSFKKMNKTGSMLYNIFQHYREDDFEVGLKLYDVFTILYLMDSESYEVKEANVQIELQGNLTRGATVVNFKSDSPNCSVVTSTVNDKYEQVFLEMLKKCK